MSNYSDTVDAINNGMCGNTFTASIDKISFNSTDEDLESACDEIIDTCLILSFLTARCVTPYKTTGQSDIQFIQLGDNFVPSRAIIGFQEITPPSLNSFFLVLLC
jgi:hypothetical protein